MRGIQISAGNDALADCLDTQWYRFLAETIMQTNILWTGREYHSMEYCRLRTIEFGFEVTSTIVGYYQDRIYKVDYHIHLNAQWKTVTFEIVSHLEDAVKEFLFVSDGEGNWLNNNKVQHQFKGCIDIDIPLTPFTNTLPIKRLQLQDGEEVEIQVLYLDLLAQQIRPVRQKYQRISKHVYHYENIPNDFEADIQVDEFGLVTDYPELFVRTARRDIHSQG